MKKSNEQRKSDRRKKRDEENFWKIMYLTSDDAPTPHVPPVPVSIIKRKLPILPFKRNDEISGIVSWLKNASICFRDTCFEFVHDIYLHIVGRAPPAPIDGGKNDNDVRKYFENNNDKLNQRS